MRERLSSRERIPLSEHIWTSYTDHRAGAFRVRPLGLGGRRRQKIVEAGPPRSRTRRITQTPESCRDRVKKLRDDGFFSERRGISEIVQGLGAQGHVHNVNQVGAALTTMFERGEILRAPVEGKFKYHWDASARTAAA
jgi:hypothetical protein